MSPMTPPTFTNSYLPVLGPEPLICTIRISSPAARQPVPAALSNFAVESVSALMVYETPSAQVREGFILELKLKVLPVVMVRSPSFPVPHELTGVKLIGVLVGVGVGACPSWAVY